MKFRRFMVGVWHINGFLILLVGLLAAGALGLWAIQTLRDMTRRRAVSDVANVSPEQTVITKSSLGDFELIPKTSVSRAPLYLKQEYDSWVGSKAASSVRNYLFFDSNRKISYWLKPINESLIINYIPISSLPGAGNSPDGKELSVQPLSNVYVLVESDTNQDQRLNELDLKTIAVSTPVGTEFKPLVKGVKQFHGHAVSRQGKVTLFYHTGNKLKAIEYDPITQAVTSESELIDLLS